MTKYFEQLSAEERVTIRVMAQKGQSLRAMARTLHRAPSTISREWHWHAGPAATPGTSGYDAKQVGQEARRRRCQPQRSPQLAVDSVLFGVVEHFLREGWSPGQIDGAMNMLWPDAPARQVAAGTIATPCCGVPGTRN